MRLGQLARKLSISTSKITDFLAQHQIQISKDANARLEDHHAMLVIKNFKPEILEEESALLKGNADQTEPIEAPIAEPVEAVTPSPVAEDIVVSVHEEQHPETVQEPAVIKAPKVELTGLRVVGKIELPEVRKKEAPREKQDGDDTTAQRIHAEEIDPSKVKRRHKRRERHTSKAEPWVNPVALQRERAEREAEQRRKEEAEKKKHQRSTFYQKQVSKKSQPMKRARLVNEPVEVLPVDTRPAPRTWWGRFLRWLSTP